MRASRVKHAQTDPRTRVSGRSAREFQDEPAIRPNEGAVGSPERSSEERDLDREIERYREAAAQALDQLEWCVDYLYRVRKPQIARVVARNRKQILARLR